jgi:hypothetical protein
MVKDPSQWASLGGKVIGGTAKPVLFPSVVPEEKSEKEVFWVSQLFSLLPEFADHIIDIESNEDDSKGNHDVVTHLSNNETIGIQVTELTSELQKSRTALSKYHTKNIVKALQRIDARATTKIAVSISIKEIERKKPIFPKPDEIAEIIKEKSLVGFSENPDVVNKGNFTLTFQPLTTGQLFIPSHSKIGISVNYDDLPRTLEMYENAVDYLVKKKSNSNSPWLIIWSSSFWQDRHWLGTELLEYMMHSFSSSQFNNVYFIESMDGEGIFQANVHWYQIK